MLYVVSFCDQLVRNFEMSVKAQFRFSDLNVERLFSSKLQRQPGSELQCLCFSEPRYLASS
jgi:hypothetical protein